MFEKYTEEQLERARKLAMVSFACAAGAQYLADSEKNKEMFTDLHDKLMLVMAEAQDNPIICDEDCGEEFAAHTLKNWMVSLLNDVLEGK